MRHGRLVLVLVLVLVLCVALVVAGCDTLEPQLDGATPSDLSEPFVDDRPPGVPADAEPAWVDRIVDGDTLRVRVDAPGGSIPPTNSERVRLLSIDAPELDHPERGEDCGAEEARDRFADLAPPGSRVWLAADVEDRDRYDRALRHVYNVEGTDVSAVLVSEGLVRARLYRPNDRFHAPLERLAGEARSAGSGVWGALCELPPWARSLRGEPVAMPTAASIAAAAALTAVTGPQR